MKKIFTLIAATMMAVCANAQTWDLTAFESADVTAEVTIEGLKYYGESKSAYAAGNKTFADETTWGGRVKFGGASTIKSGSLSRVFEFTGKKGATLKVYAVHGSSSGDPRNVFVTQTLTDTNRDTAPAFGTVATEAAAESPAVLVATVPEDGPVYVWADNNVGIHAIIQESGTAGISNVTTASAAKVVKAIENGQLVIKAANGKFNVAGARVK